MTKRIELPYAVFVHVIGDTGKINRFGQHVRNPKKRYFDSKESALAFCRDIRRVLFRPQDGVWTEREC
jgi:hypothetical protein